MKKNEQKSSKAQRGGDTSRSSSQGRKLSSGGEVEEKGKKIKNDSGNNPKQRAGKVNE
ncbi:MAG TPA: hypothetical protein VFD56_06630 [Chitinophagaceae bacterium]|nr:hypothetical protein [Chitinophagaceae bacterium]